MSEKCWLNGGKCIEPNYCKHPTHCAKNDTRASNTGNEPRADDLGLPTMASPSIVRAALASAPQASQPTQEAREYQPLPEADAWPLGPAVPFFGPEKMRSYVDADRKARQQDALDAAREALLLFCNDRVLTEFSAGRLRTYWDRRNEVVDKLRAALAKGERYEPR